MGLAKPYVSILSHAIALIQGGQYSAADLLVNNFYHRHKRSAKDYMALLRITRSHLAYTLADESTKNQLAKILYLLDRKHNHSYHTIYVAFRKEIAPDGSIGLFSIEEKRTPAL